MGCLPVSFQGWDSCIPTIKAYLNELHKGIDSDHSATHIQPTFPIFYYNMCLMEHWGVHYKRDVSHSK